MAQKHGGVFTTLIDGFVSSNTVPAENIGGIVFDIGGRTNPFNGFTTAQAKLGNRQVVEVNSVDDLAELGIEDGVEAFMNGVPYYHIAKFFAVAGEGQRLFIMFADCTSNFDAIEDLQVAAKGLCFQIGLWTEKELFKKVNDSLAINDWVANVHTVAEKLGGRIVKKGSNYINYDGNAQASILINANPGYITGETPVVEINLATLPNAIAEMPYVSLLLGQESSDAIHAMQLLNTHQCPVGNIGLAMGVLAVAPVECSMGWVQNFNLYNFCQAIELGFGNLAVTGSGSPIAWAANASFTNIDTLSYTKRSTQLVEKGYNILTNYDGFENGTFFSSDSTLATGDYESISRCRTMSKTRRLIRMALLKYTNAPLKANATTGLLSVNTLTTIKNDVVGAIDEGMVDPGTTNAQISGRTVDIDANQNVIKTHELLIDYGIVPVAEARMIKVTGHFTLSTR